MNARKHVWVFGIGLLCVLCAGVISIAAHPQQNPPQENAQPQTPPTDPQDPRFKLNVEVELVNITATVLDEQGKYMDGLKLEDFQVFEDGEEQKISFFSHDLRVPISVGVLIDNSGSMRHKLQQALQTVREIATALGPQDEMFVISFNSDVDVRHHLTTNMQDIQRSFRDIKAGGETAAGAGGPGRVGGAEPGAATRPVALVLRHAGDSEPAGERQREGSGEFHRRVALPHVGGVSGELRSRPPRHRRGSAGRAQI